MLKFKTKRPKKEVSLPQFPKFTYLTAQHQTHIKDIVKNNYPYSDFNFISMWSWDHQNKLMLCMLNNNLVIKFQDYQDPNDYFYSFFGSKKVDQTIATLLEHSNTEGKTELKLIPQFIVDNLKHPEKYIISEDRDSFDYIVAIDEMIELEKTENRKKRWSMNRLQKEHGHDLEVKELDITDQQTSNDLLSVIENWRQQMVSRDSYNESEIKAVKKMITGHSEIKTDNLHVVGIYLSKNLEAFSITEVLGGGFAMAHYKKNNRNFRGLSVALEHHTAKALQANGVSHLNHEQDLGIEGLREAKLAHHPVYFLKKYTISLKN